MWVWGTDRGLNKHVPRVVSLESWMKTENVSSTLKRGLNLLSTSWCRRYVKTSSRSNWNSVVALHMSISHTFFWLLLFGPAPYLSVCSRSVTISMACESIMQITIISAKEQPLTHTHRHRHTGEEEAAHPTTTSSSWPLSIPSTSLLSNLSPPSVGQSSASLSPSFLLTP